MQNSFLDILPPDTHAHLRVFAGVTMLAGVALWSTGIKIAHASISFLFGIALAAAASIFLPDPTGLAPLTCGLIGFVAGALLGALAFRLLQGVALALCLGLAVAGIYIRWHLPDALVAPITLTQPAAKAQSADTSAPAAAVETFKQVILTRWRTIPIEDQQRIAVFSLAAAISALLIAYAAPRPTTWTISALLGALLLLAGSFAMVHAFLPQYQHYFPDTPQGRYLTLGLVTLLGMAIQYRFFWPAPKPTPITQPESPLPPATASS